MGIPVVHSTQTLTLWRKYRTFKRLTGQQRKLWLEAWLWLGLSRVGVLIIPFKYLAPHLGQQSTEPEPNLTEEAIGTVQQIRWAIRRAACNTPWNSNCLARAITAKRMLQKRKLSSTLYLGVRKNEAGELQAHAWVRCGSFWVTGEQGHRQYTVVSTFADT